MWAPCAKFCFLTLLLIGCGAMLEAQELRCQVTVNGSNVKSAVGVDARVFQSMQTSINEFMNSKTWTTDVFGPEERIECSMFINVTGNPAQDIYEAKVTVQCSRPVFNSAYNSPVFNFLDNDWQFTYIENQPIEFNVTQFNNNLSSLLGYYAYLFIGLDYDCFSKMGGSKYFGLAEQVVNNVPTGGPDAKGWRPFDGQRNRYWIINNIQSGKYDNFRQAMYDYHLAGLDNFYDKPQLARTNILNALDKLNKIASDNPNAVLLAVLFQAKSDELVGIFSGAEMSEKAKAVGYLRKIDPSNATKYEKILKG